MSLVGWFVLIVLTYLFVCFSSFVNPVFMSLTAVCEHISIVLVTSKKQTDIRDRLHQANIVVNRDPSLHNIIGERGWGGG